MYNAQKHIVRTTAIAALAAVALGAAAAPQIASAATACGVVKTHAVKKIAHHVVKRRPVAVAAYREARPVTRTVVETRYIREPARVIVAPAPVYYHREYAPYPVYYSGYGYDRTYYHGGYYHRPIVVYHHRHW